MTDEERIAEATGLVLAAWPGYEIRSATVREPTEGIGVFFRGTFGGRTHRVVVRAGRCIVLGNQSRKRDANQDRRRPPFRVRAARREARV